MDNRFDLIVFDWDGTLQDSAGAIVRAIMAACDDLGLPRPSEQAARHVIGLGLVDAMRHAVPGLLESDYPRMVERYRHHYLSSDHELRLFEGTDVMLNALQAQGCRLAVATGKSRLGLNRALAHTGLKRLFETSRCADECFSKPHPAMLHELMEETGVAPERTLMIGDTTHDLQMAINAGVAGVGVAFGAHPRAALASMPALAIHDTPADLARWLSVNV